MNKRKTSLALFLTSISAGNLYAIDNMQIVKDHVLLITSPDILISKDILRSEVLNELKYKQQYQQLLRKIKEEEINNQKLQLEEYKINLDKKNLNLKLNQYNLENEKINFEKLKLLKKEEYLNEYPFTTLGFKPDKLDLVRNILIAKQEESKKEKIKLLKKINVKNLIILKKQYVILKNFELYFNKIYYNLLTNDYVGAAKNIEVINKLILDLLKTNILYMRNEYVQFRIEIIKLRTIVNKIISLNIEKNNKELKKELKLFNQQYNIINQIYFKIRDSLLNKIIKLQQINQNEFYLIEKLFFNIKNKKVNLNNNNALKNNKDNNTIILSKEEEIKYYKQKLAIELGIPVIYLKYLTFKDIGKIKSFNEKINFYKNFYNQINNKKIIDKKLIINLSKLLGYNEPQSKIILKAKLINILTSLIKEKYKIIDNVINKYKKEQLLKRQRKLMLEKIRLKKLELERKRKLLLEKIRLKKLEEARKKRLEEEKRRRLREIQEEKRREMLMKQRMIVNKLKRTFEKYKYIGIINNNIAVQDKEGNIIYLSKGKVIGNYKIQNVDDSGLLTIYDMKNYKTFKYNIIEHNLY